MKLATATLSDGQKQMDLGTATLSGGQKQMDLATAIHSCDLKNVTGAIAKLSCDQWPSKVLGIRVFYSVVYSQCPEGNPNLLRRAFSQIKIARYTPPSHHRPLHTAGSCQVRQNSRCYCASVWPSGCCNQQQSTDQYAWIL